MKKLIKILIGPILACSLFFFAAPNINRPTEANLCNIQSISPTTVAAGGTIRFVISGQTGHTFTAGITSPATLVSSSAPTPVTINVTVPSSAPAGPTGVGARDDTADGAPDPDACLYSAGVTTTVTITASTGGGGGSLDLGTIKPGTSIPSVSGDPSTFVASAIRSSISLLIIVAFIVDLIWTIFGGIRFVTAGGDPKTVGAAWSQIYWGLIGMVVVMGSFAIIKLVETFFQVSIISGGFRLPTI